MKKILITVIAFAVTTTARSQVKLPRLIRDSMILQRDSKINIWGWAQKDEKVSIRFNGKTYKSKTAADGKWMVVLPAMKAGGPYTMDIAASNKISLKDILIGDVWLCSGQSNMVHQMKLHSIRYADEVATANNPQIRQFWIPTTSNLQGPADDLPAGFWKSANPQDIPEFSVVAYFFAKDIYEKYQVPVGLINASVGGSPIESWTSEEGLKEFPLITGTIRKNKDTAYINDITRRSLASNANRPKPEDRGLTGPTPWYEPTYVVKGWHTIQVPGYWEDQGIKDLEGIVWYRKEVNVPASMTGVPARVFLGRIVDADVLYINGKQVGNTTYMYPQRRYNVPADLLKAGKNIFVVKVTNNSGKGGFVPDKPYCLFAGKDSIDLKGDWQYKVGEVFMPQRGGGTGGMNIQNQPTALYNAMIAPLTNYSLKGFLWYQGESNTGRAEEYKKLQPAMIADWRSRWKQGDLPFLYVQLPNFMDANYLPSESQWAEFRDAQLKCLSVANSAMAVTIDLGEWNDLHPDRKKEIGNRLALAAMKLAYGENIVYSGPVYQSASINEDKIIISFSNTGSGLIAMDGEELSQFSIAGADKKFVWAKAKIVLGTPSGEGDKVIVWNDTVSNPMYVRYAWADNPDGANLYNKEGLPASPFRTD
jgi:sialate O-acetylesterase